MIKEALSYISEDLNQALKRRLDLKEDKVQLSNLVNPDGSLAMLEDNKVVVTLIRAEEETVIKGNDWVRSNSGTTSKGYPPVHLNLFVLFTASFYQGNYSESLKFLSEVVGFFQSKSMFNRQNSPGLDPAIDKLIAELYKSNFQELSHIWGMMGAKYLPSVIYKVRMVTIDQGQVRDQAPSISGSAPDNQGYNA